MKELIFITLVFCVACQNPSSDFSNTTDTSIFLEECLWEEISHPIFERDDIFVTFKFEQCFNDGSDHISVSNDGQSFEKLTFDIVYSKFHVFEMKDMTQKELVESKIEPHPSHQGPCKAVNLAPDIWRIDDGLPENAIFRSMPCGWYGRNFFSQTEFKFVDGVALNYSSDVENSEIDIDSIRIIREPK